MLTLARPLGRMVMTVPASATSSPTSNSPGMLRCSMVFLPMLCLFDALLNQCPATALVACNPLRTVPHISKLDRDGDGTPCETLC
ncbi:MAG: excalibur calcium-binding domain-containing protein [Mesorhizobium sp.]|nr:MAG: excalibur calcium-binding domain-containing protein [Mesorhizobium sp.]